MIIAKFDESKINKVPEHCYGCPFIWYHEEWYGETCVLTNVHLVYDEIEGFDMHTQRLSNCPLVEVKEG